MSVTSLAQAVRAWVIAASGLDDKKVVYARSKAPRPEPPFLTVDLGDRVPVGMDATSWTFDSNAAEGEEIVIAAEGHRRLSVRIQAVTKSGTGTGSATDLLDRVVTALALPSVRRKLVKAGLGVLERGAVRAIPQLLDTEFEGRAVVDVAFDLVTGVTEATGYIDDVEIEGDMEA